MHQAKRGNMTRKPKKKYEVWYRGKLVATFSTNSRSDAKLFKDYCKERLGEKVKIKLIEDSK